MGVCDFYTPRTTFFCLWDCLSSHSLRSFLDFILTFRHSLSVFLSTSRRSFFIDSTEAGSYQQGDRSIAKDSNHGNNGLRNTLLPLIGSVNFTCTLPHFELQARSSRPNAIHNSTSVHNWPTIIPTTKRPIQISLFFEVHLQGRTILPA